jgi:DNA-binding transcriptional LysR family regulator
MDPRRLLTFRTVAHERSFSRAAERLSLSQPSVSTQVALLETDIGVRLFDRARRGLRLTHAGEVLLEHADHVAWRLELADTQIAALAHEKQAEIRIGAFPTALAGLVPAAATALQAIRHDIRVRLSEVVPSALEPRLLSGAFDIALSYQDASLERREIKGVERIDLIQETFLIGLPPDHPLAHGDAPIALSELAEDDWILPSTEGFLIDACREAGFEPHIVAISQESISSRGMIQRGLGIGWVPSLLADDYRHVVAVRPVDGPMRRRDIYALLPPGERHHHVGDVLAALREAAEAFEVSPAAFSPSWAPK